MEARISHRLRNAQAGFSSAKPGLRIGLLSGTAICLGLSLPGPAGAQVTQQGQADVKPSEAGPAAGGGTGGRLEEIVVTAQRRSERLQNVPLAVTSLSAASLAQQGVSSTANLSQAVPSLVFTSQLSAANPYIRGVGSQLFDPTSESPVAVYVDDVYIANPQGNIFSLAGTKQIDVLNGPQGTLFGRNATGGVIQIQTLDPTQELHLDVSATYASYGFVSVPAYVSTGVGDNVATSISALYENQARGYGHNLSNGSPTFQQARHNISVRNKWLVTLPTNTTIRISGDYARLGNTDTYQRPEGSFSLLPGAAQPTGYPGEYNSNTGINDFTRVRTGGLSLKIDQDLGAISVTSITAYRKLRTDASLDQDQSTVAALDLTWKTRFHNVSQEFRIQNRSNKTFNWIAGAFYYDATGAYDDLEADGATYIAYDEQHVRSVAGFAQGTLTLFSSTNLTGGVRYTSDDIHYAFPSAGLKLGDSVGRTTFRVALDHHFSRDILGYVSYNTGFKSGGFNLLAPGDAFRPEELKSFEVGLKTELFDRSLRLNIDGFLYRYSDQQVSIPSIGGDIVANAAGSHIKGFEASLDYRPTRRLKFSGGVSLLDGHYTNYPGYQSYDPDGIPVGPPHNVKGNRTVQTPKFIGNLSAEYDLPTALGEFIPAVSLQHNSGFFETPDNLVRNPAYNVVNASLTWKPNGTNIAVKVWGRNLADATYYILQSRSAAPVGDTQVQAPPRTFGATVSYHY